MRHFLNQLLCFPLTFIHFIFFLTASLSKSPNVYPYQSENQIKQMLMISFFNNSVSREKNYYKKH